MLLWLWCRPAAIGPLAWEPPNAVGAALKRQKDQKKKSSPQGLCPCLEEEVESLTVFKEQSVISSWIFSWLVDGEVIWSQHHQPSTSNPSGVYMLVGCTQLTSSTWWGLYHLQNSSKDMAQNIIYSSWGRTNPWLYWMVKLLLLVLLNCFSFSLYFPIYLIKLILWLEFFYKQREVRGQEWWW